MARASGRPGTSASRGRSASRSRPSPSGSRCSRRRSRSATACSRASAAPRRAFRGPPVPGRAPAQLAAVDLAAARADHGGRRRREEDAAARGPVRGCVQRLRLARGASPASTRSCARHCEAIGRDPDEIERSTLQNIDPILPGGRGRESVERIVDRFGDLADAGAQHVILGMPDADDPRPARGDRTRHHPGDPGPVGIPPRGIQTVVVSRP